MRTVTLILLSIVVISCQTKEDIIGKWQRVEYLEEENLLEGTTSPEIKVSLSYNVTLDITNDSICFIQEDTIVKKSYKVNDDNLLFLDHSNRYELKWKIIEINNDFLLLGRNQGGFHPLYFTLKFDRLETQ